MMAQETITVTLMSGPQDGLQIRLELPAPGNRAIWTIGRSDDCDVALAYDVQVSRTHARLICAVSDETATDNDPAMTGRLSLKLEDAGSRNGTVLEDRRLRSEAADVLPGQLFRVGRTWLRVEL